MEFRECGRRAARSLVEFRQHPESVRTARFSHDNRHILTVGEEGTACIHACDELRRARLPPEPGRTPRHPTAHRRGRSQICMKKPASRTRRWKSRTRTEQRTPISLRKSADRSRARRPLLSALGEFERACLIERQKRPGPGAEAREDAGRAQCRWRRHALWYYPMRV